MAQATAHGYSIAWKRLKTDPQKCKSYYVNTSSVGGYCLINNKSTWKICVYHVAPPGSPSPTHHADRLLPIQTHSQLFCAFPQIPSRPYLFHVISFCPTDPRGLTFSHHKLGLLFLTEKTHLDLQRLDFPPPPASLTPSFPTACSLPVTSLPFLMLSLLFPTA